MDHEEWSFSEWLSSFVYTKTEDEKAQERIQRVEAALIPVQKDIQILQASLNKPPEGATPEFMDEVREKLKKGLASEADALASLSMMRMQETLVKKDK